MKYYANVTRETHIGMLSSTKLVITRSHENEQEAEQVNR